MNAYEKIDKLESEVRKLKYQVLVLNNVIFTEPPSWAENSHRKAVLCGLEPSPYGESLDMCRVLKLLDVLGLLC